MTTGDVPSTQFLTLESLRLILFGGKGGVGKTSCAFSAALLIAQNRPGSKVVLVSTDPAHSTSDALHGDSLPPNFSLVEFDAEGYHERFMAEHKDTLRRIASVGTFLEDDDIAPLLDLSLPGVDELMAFLQIADWTHESRADVLVVDTAPTGHTLRLLEMPELLGRWLAAIDALLAKHRYMAGVFGVRKTRDALEDFMSMLEARLSGLQAVLKNPRACRFVPVTLAETPAIEETSRLLEALQRLSIASPEVIINQLLPESATGSLAWLRDTQQRCLRELPAAFTARALWGVPMSGLERLGVEGLSGLLRSAAPLAPAPAQAPSTPGSIGSIQPGEPISAGAVEGSLPLPTNAKLLVVAGKGGVGKTTVACALAAQIAQRGTPVTLISCDPAHSLADCLMRPVGSESSPIAENLSAIALDAHTAFAALRANYEEEIAAAMERLLGDLDASMDREAMSRIMDLSPPGLDEVMALLRVVDLLEQPGPGLVVLDTAPTGHLLRLLHLPELIDQWIKAIFTLLLRYDKILRLTKVKADLVKISKGAKRLRALLTDSSASAVVPVCIPTEMALAETTDLLESCAAMKLSVPGLVVNLVTPEANDELTRALRTRETASLAGFTRTHATMPQARIPRLREPRGVEALAALGGAILKNTRLSSATAQARHAA